MDANCEPELQLFPTFEPNSFVSMCGRLMSNPNCVWVHKQFTMIRDIFYFSGKLHRGMRQMDSRRCPSIHFFIALITRVTPHILERKIFTIYLLFN